MTVLAQLKTLFVITITTSRMIFPGMPPSDAPEEKNGPGFEAAVKSVALDLTSDKYSVAAKAECAMPQGLGQGKSVKLTITPLLKEDPKPADKAKGASAQEPKMRIYWGNAGVIPAGQPKIVSRNEISSIAKIGSAEPGATAEAAQDASYAYWPGPDTKPLSASAAASGAYALTTNYCGSASITLDKEQDFLPPIDLAGTDPHIDLAKAMGVRWKKVPNAKAYLLTAFGGNNKGTTVWVSSSNSAWMDIADVTNRALSTEELKKLIKDGILLPPDTTSCTVPAGVFKDADTAMLVVMAIGADKIEAKDGIATSVILRSSATVPLSDWSNTQEPKEDIPSPPTNN